MIDVLIGQGSERPSQYKTVILKSNVDFRLQVLNPNTKYVIKNNFDLKGQTVNIPNDVILAIDGGKLQNGTLVGNNTILINVNKVDNILENITKEGTWKEYSHDPTNLGLMYFDKVKKVPVWWDGENFIEWI